MDKSHIFSTSARANIKMEGVSESENETAELI